MNTEAHKRLAAARSRLLDVERRLAAACEVCRSLEIALEVAAGDLEHALQVSRANPVLLQSQLPRAMPVSRARDAFATARARLQAAVKDVRAAEKEKAEATKELEAAREAFADGGSWNDAATWWHAEAQRLEQAARDARAEANYAEQKHQQSNDITNLPIHVLNRMAAGGTR